MKRKLFFVSAGLICILCFFIYNRTTTKHGEELSVLDDGWSGTTTITAHVEACYTLAIPDNGSIAFNSLSTDIGSIELTSAVFPSGEHIDVTVEYDKLINSKDSSKSIVYTLKNGSSSFRSADFFDVGDKVPLSVAISKQAWDMAYTGSYSDMITFTISFEKNI